MTHHHHTDIAALERSVEQGDQSVEAAAQRLIDEVSTAFADEQARIDHLNALREQTSDGVGLRIVEEALGTVYPEHPTL